ncbi:MAG: UDP-2,3-diacylglucosamine diphosphatase, partial [Gammaproteobacteria bacterium]|nr:UDP-2,3-diacylglucosamine diphosphatase [Gammaproteobacteria bacterium]
IEGTLYANTGDWVESCSALIESEQGQLSLVRHSQPAARRSCAAAPLLADPA